MLHIKLKEMTNAVTCKQIFCPYIVKFRLFLFAGSRGSCLNSRPLGRVFKHLPRDPTSVNAMKQTCVIVILAYLPDLSINRAENVA